MRAIKISSFGEPRDVLELVDAPEPSAPRAGEVLIGVEFAPVNHNDLLLIRGTFHWSPSLPAYVGNEGVGRILAVGVEVTNVKVGDRVLLPVYSRTWQERVVVLAEGLMRVPESADIKQMAMLRVNPPSAALMLGTYVDLKPGDWVIQNAANSGVGRAVIAFGQARGLRVINLVRREEAIAEVEAAGGKHVLVDDADAAERIAAIVGTDTVSLALDGVGGDATARLAKSLSEHGHLAAYAFMGGYANIADLRPLMDKELHLHSFYSIKPEYEARIPGILKEALDLIVAGKLSVPVAATYPLSAIRDAVIHTEGGGKVLLDIAKV